MRGLAILEKRSNSLKEQVKNVFDIFANKEVIFITRNFPKTPCISRTKNNMRFFMLSIDFTLKSSQISLQVCVKFRDRYVIYKSRYRIIGHRKFVNPFVKLR